MKTPRRLANRQTSLLTVVLLVAAVSVGIVGTHDMRSSSAATAYTHNPDGDVDSCALVNNITTLYGWAHDTDAPAGANPLVSIRVNSAVNYNIPSDIAGYRDTAVNNYLHTKYPGMPTSSVYGWKTSFSGLYKGGTYTISGVVVNYGTGANVAIPINSDHYVDGDSSKTYFTTSHTIPDKCLAFTTVPSPTPTPAPSPSPSPSPSPTPTPVGSPKSTGKTTKTAIPSVGASNAADASVTASTTTADLQLPAGSATTIHVLYGTDAAKPDQLTPDQPTNGNTQTAHITGLNAKTTYYFQIVRTLNGTSVTSPSASFMTSGYSLSLVMTSKGKPVKGIKGSLNKQQATSGKDGKLTFSDVGAGTYILTFDYQGKTYAQAVNTADTVSSNPDATSIDQAVDLDTLLQSAIVKTPPAAARHSAWPKVIVLLLVVLLIIAGLWWFVRRRRAATDPYSTPTVDVLEEHSRHQLKKKEAVPAAPLPAHAGTSLRQMVVESMHAEAAKRRNQPPSDPPPRVPGGQ